MNTPLLHKNNIHHSILLMSDATTLGKELLLELKVIAQETRSQELLIVEEPQAGGHTPELDLEIYRQCGFAPCSKSIQCQELLGIIKKDAPLPLVLLRKSCAEKLSPTNRNSLLKKALERIAQETVLMAEGIAGAALCQGTRTHNRLHAKLGLGTTIDQLGLGMLPMDYVAINATLEIENVKKAIESLPAKTGVKLVASCTNTGVICQNNGHLTIRAAGTVFIAHTRCHQLGMSTIG